MYRECFVTYLKENCFTNNPLQNIVDYLLKNEEASYTRAQLVLAWAGKKIKEALPLALAVECLHCASLFHDDLPCMDDGKTRRGKPCAHIEFNEAGAVLAGDAAIALAYSMILSSQLSAEDKIRAIDYLSYTLYTMCEGQYKEIIKADEDIAIINREKTAHLIATACYLGALASGDEQAPESAIRYGLALGQNYQIIDDIKDNDGITLYYSKEEIQSFLEMNKKIYSDAPTSFLRALGTKLY